MMYFYPVGGLGNQIRSVACTYTWSLALQEPLTVYFNPDEWQIVQALRTQKHWDLCFDTPALPFKVERIPVSIEVLFDVRFWDTWTGVWRPVAKFEKIIHPEVSAVSGLTLRQGIERAVERGWVLSADSGHWFGELKTVPYKEVFKPLSALTERHLAGFLKTVEAKFGKDYRGIHLRYAQPPAAELSPYSLFARRLKAEPGPFFLATDVVEVREKFLELFGRTDVFYNPWPRLEQKDAEDTWMAFVDMMLLARSKCIFGAHCSSFDEIASWWGGVPLTKVQNNPKK